MWTGLFGNATAEKVLLYLERYGEGYSMGIAKTFELPVSQIQRQLLRFEAAGILISQTLGRVRVFLWNPRCYFLRELKATLGRIHQFLPREVEMRFFLNRKRPRRTGKPLR